MGTQVAACSHVNRHFVQLLACQLNAIPHTPTRFKPITLPIDGEKYSWVPNMHASHFPTQTAKMIALQVDEQYDDSLWWYGVHYWIIVTLCFFLLYIVDYFTLVGKWSEEVLTFFIFLYSHHYSSHHFIYCTFHSQNVSAFLPESMDEAMEIQQRHHQLVVSHYTIIFPFLLYSMSATPSLLIPFGTSFLQL